LEVNVADQPLNTDENMECPLCRGKGQLTRAEALERLGMRDLTRVAQISAEEALRLLLKKHEQEANTLWMRFETEMNKRLNDVTSKHQRELQALSGEKNALELRLQELQRSQEILVKNAKDTERLEVEKDLQEEIVSLKGKIKDFEARERVFDQQRNAESEKIKADFQQQIAKMQSESNDLNRKVNDYSQEIASLRDKNQKLEVENSKFRRSGKKEEISFAEEAQTWPGIWLSEKQNRTGDYFLAYRDPSGEPLEPRMLVDNKDKSSVTEDDINKLIRDAKEHGAHVAALVARDESQLRSFDKERRWATKDGVWILRTTRPWIHRDLDILKPVLARMREEGPDFLTKNSRLAEEIRATFADIDEIEKQLIKAAKEVMCAKDMTSEYRTRLQRLCDATAPRKEATSVAKFPETVSA
jgi:phage host-nuclease inhibitor protein Gam